jgi:hypothetical protein
MKIRRMWAAVWFPTSSPLPMWGLFLTREEAEEKRRSIPGPHHTGLEPRVMSRVELGALMAQWCRDKATAWEEDAARAKAVV